MTGRNSELGRAPTATLSSLPIELKFMIVQSTFDADMLNAEAGRKRAKPKQHTWVARNGRCNHNTGLSALRQLDACFRGITERFVWKTIDVTEMHTGRPEAMDTRNLHKQTFGSTKRILWTGIDSQAVLQQALFVESLLVHRLYPACFQISSLEFGGWVGCEAASESISRILVDGLPTLAGSLVVLQLNLEPLKYTAMTIAKIIRPLHLLEVLRLVGVCEETRPGVVNDVEPLGEQLESLSRLCVLELINCPGMNNWWRNGKWAGPIRSLKLRNCSGLSSEILAASLRELGTRLEYIELVDCITSDSGKGLDPIKIPHLRSMRLAASPLPRFLLSALAIGTPHLRQLVLDARQTHPVHIMHYIRSWSRLNQLKCKLKGGEGSLDLIVYCFQRRIELEESFY